MPNKSFNFITGGVGVGGYDDSYSPAAVLNDKLN